MKNLRFFTTKPRDSIVELFQHGEIVCKQTDELSGVIREILGFDGFIWAYATSTNETKIHEFSGKFVVEFKRPSELYTLDKIIKYFIRGLDGNWYKKDLNMKFKKEDFILNTIDGYTTIVIPKLTLDDVISISSVANGVDIDMNKLIKKNLDTFRKSYGRNWTAAELR